MEKGLGRVAVVEETSSPSSLPSHGLDRKTAPPSSPLSEDLERDTAPYSQDQRKHQPVVTPVHTKTDQVIELNLIISRHVYIIHRLLPNFSFTWDKPPSRNPIFDTIIFYLCLSRYTLTHGCPKVHGEVPIVLCIFLDPL